MRILITNDDGYRAEGIVFLSNYLKEKGHKIYIIAPETEKSGCSHSLTFSDSIKLVYNNENLWAIRGTPVDCVLLGILSIIPEKVDFVISGINHGPNIGKDIIYSGTAAAAREAGFNGIKSIALSMNAWRPKFFFETAKDFLDKYLDKLFKLSYENYFLNINFPNIPKENIKGIKITKPCINHYFQDEIIHFDSPFQGRYYWIKGSNPSYKLQEDTDAYAVKNGYISVTPVKIFPEASETKIDL